MSKRPFVLNFSSPISNDSKYISRAIERFSKDFNQIADLIYQELYGEDLLFVEKENLDIEITNMTSENTGIKRNYIRMLFKEKIFNITIASVIKAFTTDKLYSKEFLLNLKDHVFIENKSYILASFYSGTEEIRNKLLNNEKYLSMYIKNKIKRSFELFNSPNIRSISQSYSFLEIIGSFYMKDPRKDKLLHVLSTKVYYIREVF